jgi:2,3-bisphosphoglycerate-dependent phosphoglycerate mutase
MYRKFQLKEVAKRVVIVRHGESIWNQESKFTGWTNIPLSDNGRREAEDIANTLSANKIYPTIVFSSALQRSIETSNIIRNQIIGNKNRQELMHFIPIHTSWRLNEKHYGTLEGVPRKHIRDLYGEKFTEMMRRNFNMKPPIVKDYPSNTEYPIYKNCYFEKIKNGESKENVLDRLVPYFENDIIYTLNENHLPLIVTHKHTARVLMKHLLNMSDENFENYDLPTNGMIVVNLDDHHQFVDSSVIKINRSYTP